MISEGGEGSSLLMYTEDRGVGEIAEVTNGREVRKRGPKIGVVAGPPSGAYSVLANICTRSKTSEKIDKNQNKKYIKKNKMKLKKQDTWSYSGSTCLQTVLMNSNI